VRVHQWISIALTATWLCACAGSGEGLDENGRPLDDPAAPLTAEFASLQARVLTPRCTGCHAGAAAPLGLRLTEDASYAALVNASSVEQPALKRVAPGNPDASYLVQKVNGSAAVGGRMPLGGPPLRADEIAALRQWILDGATAPRGPAPADAAPAQVAAVFPLQSARVDFQPLGLPAAMLGPVVLAANVELDAPSLTEASVRLEASGGDGGFDEGNEVRITPLNIRMQSDDPAVFTVEPRGPWLHDRYRLVVTGDGTLPARDRGLHPIDGDWDLRAGGDYILLFDVGPEAAR
jgi:hypothetical protein